MAQTNANFADVMKEVWSPDRLQKQFYDENPILDRMEKTNRFTIGKQAQVPIHKGRNGGLTSVAAGTVGNLNTAGEQRVDQAQYTLVEEWAQVQLAFGTLNQAGGGAQSVASAMNTEVEGALSDIRKSVMRQLASDGTGILAEADTGGASTTVELTTAGYGYDAIVRGWLYPGLPVDIGTTADSDAIVAGSAITAVKEDATDPDITISSSVSTVSGTDFVSVANPNSGTARNPEINGLKQIVSTAGATGRASLSIDALGGLDPSNAGEEFWAAASLDTSTTVLSLDLLLNLQRAIHQKTGKKQTFIAASLKQEQNFYSLLQNQVRFSSDSVGAGKSGGNWNGLEFLGVPDIVDREVYMLTLDDFLIVTGKYTGPQWASDVEGAGGRLRWGQGTTGFNDGLVYALNVGVTRRNSHAAATGLTG